MSTMTHTRPILYALLFSGLLAAPLAAAKEPGGDEVVAIEGDLKETVGGHRTLVVGKTLKETVGASVARVYGLDSLEEVGRDRSEIVLGDSQETVGGDASVAIGGDLDAAIGGVARVAVDREMSLAVRRALLVESADGIEIRSGASSILLKRNGEIVLRGSKVSI